MTDLERLVEEALYEQVQTVSRDKSIVRDAASGRLCIIIYNQVQ